MNFIWIDIIFIARCSNGQMKLAAGSETYGRVEICSDQRWTTLSYNQWSYANAQVACIQLGFESMVQPVRLLMVLLTFVMSMFRRLLFMALI